MLRQALVINSSVRRLSKRCGFGRVLCHVYEGLEICNSVHVMEKEVVWIVSTQPPLAQHQYVQG